MRFSDLRRQNKHQEAIQFFMDFVKENFDSELGTEQGEFTGTERGHITGTILEWLSNTHGIDGVVLGGLTHVFNELVDENFPLAKPKLDPDALAPARSFGGGITISIRKVRNLAEKNAATLAGYLVIDKSGQYLLGPLFPPPDEKLKNMIQNLKNQDEAQP